MIDEYRDAKGRLVIGGHVVSLNYPGPNGGTNPSWRWEDSHEPYRHGTIIRAAVEAECARRVRSFRASQSRRVALIDNPGSTADTTAMREGGMVTRRKPEQRLVTKLRNDFPSEYYEQSAKIDLVDKTLGRAYEAKSGRSNVGAAAGQVMLYIYKMWETNQLLLTPWLLLDWEPSDIELTWLHKQGVGVVYLIDNEWYETT
jgi:hypothetical protein